MAEPPSYAGALVLLLISLALGGAVIALGRTSGGRRGTIPYEGGERTGHKTWVQFRVRYAVLALLFVAFDMEMVYMFPWAVVFRRLGLIAFLDMFVFLLILIAALVFAWKEGALDWER
jgi:NADH:ubiquinone oxidoreductase subunit 3 (subunit A)